MVSEQRAMKLDEAGSGGVLFSMIVGGGELRPAGHREL